MKKLLILVIFLAFLVGCSQTFLDEQQEHDGVTCVYKVHRDFWGKVKSREMVACSVN